MTSQDRAIEITKINLQDIFGERDATKRLRTISDTWGASGEVLFVDETGVFKTHEAISGVVETIQSLGDPDDGFIELSSAECLKHDDDEDTWVTRVKWGVGSKDEKSKLTGWDVLTIVNGRIRACYTFLDAR